MTDISTQYLGLKLKNPIIIGSSGLTGNIEKLKILEEKGAAAVVLKSIFEEEITLEYNKVLAEAGNAGYAAENLDYLDYHIKQDNISKYVSLIKLAKETLKIPVIASINCSTSGEWSDFAKKIEDAGADAIELNAFIFPYDIEKDPELYEELYFDIVENVLAKVKIPVALKMSNLFTNIAKMIYDLSQTGLKGLVLFNRFHSPDVDLENQKIVSSNLFSSPLEHTNSLRWIGLMAKKVNCDLCSSTGIHDGTTVLKHIMAGASAVQVVSAVYQKSTAIIQDILEELSIYMERFNYQSINDFKGKLSVKAAKDHTAYERAQFMTYYGGYDGNVK